MSRERQWVAGQGAPLCPRLCQQVLGGAAPFPFPFSTQAFPSSGVCLQPVSACKLFHRLPALCWDYPLPPHSHGDSGIPRAGSFITATGNLSAAPSRRWLCHLSSAALLCPVPSFSFLLPFPNSYLGRLPSQAIPV